MVSQILLLGYQGEITGSVKTPFDKPLIELDSYSVLEEIDSIASQEGLSLKEVKNYFARFYKSWGRFGFMGDIISIKCVKAQNEYIYFLDFIGRLAFNKPGLAADLFMIIKTIKANYFVGIKRKNNPGQGKLAFPGGFINVNGYELDTPLETIIHEAEEEIGLKIEVDCELDLKNYSVTNAIVGVDYLGTNFAGELFPLGTYATGDNEKLPTIGLKRVYATMVFALLLDMTSVNFEDFELSEGDINNWLKAGDDASSLIVVNLNDNKKLEFGIEHHQNIYDENIQGLLFSLMDD